MLFTSAFSKQNSVISLEEWVLVFKLLTTATRKLRVKTTVRVATLRLTLQTIKLAISPITVY